MDTRFPEKGEEKKLLELEEDHFDDVKSYRIKPGSLQETFVSFANSDGGELYVGIEDKKTVGERIVGYPMIESANDTIHTLLEETKPVVEYVELEFVNFGQRGYVLHVTIPKSPKVHYCSNGDCYIRVNARKKRITGERISALAYAKGIYSYEKQPVADADTAECASGPLLRDYIQRIEFDLGPADIPAEAEALVQDAERRVRTKRWLHSPLRRRAPSDHRYPLRDQAIPTHDFRRRV